MENGENREIRQIREPRSWRRKHLVCSRISRISRLKIFLGRGFGRLHPDLPVSNAARSLLKTFCVCRIRLGNVRYERPIPPKTAKNRFWGVHDGQSWRNYWPITGRTDYPLLFDRRCQPKPALDAVIKLPRGQA